MSLDSSINFLSIRAPDAIIKNYFPLNDTLTSYLVFSKENLKNIYLSKPSINNIDDSLSITINAENLILIINNYDKTDWPPNYNLALKFIYDNINKILKENSLTNEKLISPASTAPASQSPTTSSQGSSRQAPPTSSQGSTSQVPSILVPQTQTPTRGPTQTPTSGSPQPPSSSSELKKYSYYRALLNNAAKKGQIQEFIDILRVNQNIVSLIEEDDSSLYAGESLLIEAARLEEKDLVLMLLNLGADPLVKSKKSGKTAADLAQLKKNTDIVEAINSFIGKETRNFEDDGKTPRQAQPQSQGPFTLASSPQPPSQPQRSIDDLKSLIDLGNIKELDAALTAQPNAVKITEPPGFFGGRTLLMHAALKGNLPGVKILLKHNADISNRDNHGLTAADIAKTASHGQIAEYLNHYKLTGTEPSGSRQLDKTMANMFQEKVRLTGGQLTGHKKLTQRINKFNSHKKTKKSK